MQWRGARNTHKLLVQKLNATCDMAVVAQDVREVPGLVYDLLGRVVH